MTLKTLLLVSVAAAGISAFSAVATPENDPSQFDRDGPADMPATTGDTAPGERASPDMAPDTGIRSAQSEKPGDQHLTTPLPPTTGTEAKAITLSQVDQPDRTLVSAPVESKDGHKIGEVAQVTLDANGKASEVVLNDAAQTRLAAGEVVFEPERGVLITQLSPSDLAPARQPKRPTAPERPPSAPAPDGSRQAPPDLQEPRGERPDY